MLRDFKEFVMRGNVVDMAVGIVIGGAFGTIIKSAVDDVLMPPVGLLLGGVDFSNLFVVLQAGAKSAGPYATLALAKAAGAVTINYGLFVASIVSFVIVALALFMCIKAMNSMRREAAAEPAPAGPATKECPRCLTAVPLKATRCPACTSDIG